MWTAPCSCALTKIKKQHLCFFLGVSEDPVMEFVASEDEKEVELDSINVSDVKVHTFFVKEHIGE